MQIRRIFRTRKQDEAWMVVEDRAARRVLVVAWWPTEDLFGVKTVSEFPWRDGADYVDAFGTALELAAKYARGGVR